MSAAEATTVHILDKDYQVACPPEERDALMRAASELDRRMRTIRQSGTVIGVERIAVMAALNLAYEVLSLSESTKGFDQALLDSMCQRLESVLETQRS